MQLIFGLVKKIEQGQNIFGPEEGQVINSLLISII